MQNDNRNRRHSKSRPNSNIRKRRANKRKKSMLYARTILSTLLCLIVLVSVSAIFRYATKLYKDKPNDSETSSVNTFIDESDAVKTEPVSSNSLSSNNWNLTLVNSENPLSKNYTTTTIELGNGQLVSTRIYDPLMKMLEAGEKEGLSFVVCSGYRPYEEQEDLFTQQIADIQAQGYSYNEAYDIAKTSVTVPGTSEHQLGLAVDIVSSNYQLLDEAQAETLEAQWLEKNCYKYGFILRYPIAKTDITGIIYEPWHYRYVGVDAATEIMKSGVTLEEYLGE